MRDFIHISHPGRVIFGQGRITSLADEVRRLDAKRVLALSTPQRADLAERAASLIGDRSAGIYTGATSTRRSK